MLPTPKFRLSKRRLRKFNWLASLLAVMAIVVAPLQVTCVCACDDGLAWCSCSSILGCGTCDSCDSGLCDAGLGSCCDNNSPRSNSCCASQEPTTQNCDSEANQNCCNDCECVCSYRSCVTPMFEASTGPEQPSPPPLTLARLAPIYELTPSSEFLLESPADSAIPSVRLHAFLSVWLN